MFNHLSMAELFIVAALGAGSAILIDTAAAVDRPLVYSFASLFEKAASVATLPPVVFYAIASALVFGGAFSIFNFRPLNRRGAFACGFASIAIIAIFLP